MYIIIIGLLIILLVKTLNQYMSPDFLFFVLIFFKSKTGKTKRRTSATIIVQVLQHVQVLVF